MVMMVMRIMRIIKMMMMRNKILHKRQKSVILTLPFSYTKTLKDLSNQILLPVPCNVRLPNMLYFVGSSYERGLIIQITITKTMKYTLQ